MLFPDLIASRRYPVLRRLFVIVLASLSFLTACKSTASIDMADTESTMSAGASGALSDNATPSDAGARFVVRGELPLSTDNVNRLIAFVEEDTGRAFVRPPVIVAQSPDDFFAGLEDDLGDFNADAEVSVRGLQALGLTTQGVGDVTRSFEAMLLSPEGILGYYDPIPDELYVPIGAPGDDDFRSLLVHELTHALDGQHADLSVLDDLIAQGDESGNYEPLLALQAVAEGRASSVQNQWMAENGVVQELPDDLGAIEDVPAALVLALSVPYTFGEQYIEANGGAAETWDLLEKPPASSEVFMVAFGNPGDEAIIDVATPTADGPVLDDVVFGASDIFVWLLGESLDPDPALIFPTLAAIDGWAGGRAVLWGNNSQSCMRIAVAADSTNDLAEIEEVTRLWAGNNPDRSVRLEADLVIVTGCAPYIP